MSNLNPDLAQDAKETESWASSWSETRTFHPED